MIKVSSLISFTCVIKSKNKIRRSKFLLKSVFVTIIMEEFKFYAKFVSKQNILNPIDCSRSSFKYIIFDESSVPPFSQNFDKTFVRRDTTWKSFLIEWKE